MHKSAFLFFKNSRKACESFDKYPSTEELINAASELNLDSIFAQDFTLTSEVISEIKQKIPNVKIYGSVTVFAPKNEEENLFDGEAVEVAGLKKPNSDFVGVCPTYKPVIERALNDVKDLLKKDVDGIWLDALRYTTHWETESPVVLDTCYCDRCLSMFEDFIGEPIEGADLEEKHLHIDGSYYHEWLKFKTEQIVSFVKAVKKVISESGKQVELGYFAIPWEDKDYGAGIKRIMAQDFELLSGLTDMFSPMLYHKMLGKPVSWVSHMVDYFWQVGAPFLPLVQTENIESNFDANEFKESLEGAVQKPSSGVCIFYLDDLMLQPDKLKIAKEFFSSN
ncbi:MAG: hypothetical protein ACOZAO_03095 [Patescibacteria group bacterium]